MAKTLIDLSAVFGVPAGIKAVLIKIGGRDSGSAAATSATCWFVVSPNDTAGSYPAGFFLAGLPNDFYRDVLALVPCNADGDIYYQCNASGVGTMDVWIEIWGYFI